MARHRLQHPAVVRVCHWAFALSLLVLIGSGLEVFSAFPSFGEKLPQSDLFVPPSIVRIGGWLGGALQWHFTFAWLLAAAMTLYFTYQFVSGNVRQVLFASRDVPGVWPMARHYFLFGPKPAIADTYNPLQKLAYSVALLLIVVSLVTGGALYKPVQLSWLVYGLGGFRLTRIWHFAAMCGLLAFIPGHLVMVVLHGWRNFASMWTGGRGQP
jgi:Ni/Fe-hydrogenase b-type cytochrome subunit